jgi:hypothetical protein
LCPICREQEGWRHVLRCDESRSWTDELINKIFTSTDPEIEKSKNKSRLPKVGLYLSRYKEKWERIAKQ